MKAHMAVVLLMCGTAAKADLLGRYFAGRDIVDGIIEVEGLTERFSRVDANIDFWNGSRNYRWQPISGQGDNYTVEWTGYLKITEPGEYGFGTISDDGSQVWINDELVVDNGETQWFDWEDNITEHDPGDPNQPVYLGAGLHSIRVRFYDAQSYDGIQLWWLLPDSGPSDIPYYGTTFHGSPPTYNPNTNWAIVPASALFTPDQINLEVCAKDLNGDGRIDLHDLAVIAAAWQTTSPTPGLADITEDGQVDLDDLAEIINVWLMPCMWDEI